MNGNLAYQEEPWEEMLDGKVVLMSPRPAVNHNRVASRIFNAFYNYLKGKPCEAFADGTDVYLTEDDHVIPDAMIICNQDIIREDAIHGTPDLIVEVISPSTAKNDKGYKKDLYERVGVREYWIANPLDKSIEVYLLSDGKYILDEVYAFSPDYDILPEDRKKAYRTEIPVSLYGDFKIPLEYIFEFPF